jgi:protein-S-isoprenylcysteine O-methyltransferase Ste14
MESRSYRVLAGSLLFTVLVPGTVTVVVPYFLLPIGAARAIKAVGLFGVIPMALGVGCYFWCAWGFTFAGGGTPAPIAPPKNLVISGPYRYVRNPMYVGVEFLIVGEAIFFGSWRLLEYAAVVGVGFCLFVLLYEEWALRKKFGAAYEEYCKTVPRWIPKWRGK